MLTPSVAKLEIRHGVEGGAKGGKGGTSCVFGQAARHAVWRSLAEREDGEDANAPLFVVRRNRSFNPDALRHLIKSIADRAGVKKAYPYKFRHTSRSHICDPGVMFFLTVVAWGWQSGYGSSLRQDRRRLMSSKHIESKPGR